MKAKTAPGRRSTQPLAYVEDVRALFLEPTCVRVHVDLSDGRTFAGHTTEWPLRDLHESLARAFVLLCGPTGSINTERSAAGLWAAARRLCWFLGSLGSNAPTSASNINAEHLDAFASFREASLNEHSLEMELGKIKRLFDALSELGLANQAAWNTMSTRRKIRRANLRVDGGADMPRVGMVDDHAGGDVDPRAGVGGYEDGEFEAIMAAARSDVVAMRARIKRSMNLIAQFRGSPAALTRDQQAEAQRLAWTLETGDVASYAGTHVNGPLAARKEWASRLFLLESDLVPLLILFVGLSRRNGETVKELAAEHSVIGGVALRSWTIKRRRGEHEWDYQVEWEIGSESRQLHRPGGLYLLVEELTSAGRRFAADSHLLIVWSNGTKHRHAGSKGHYYPWARGLGKAAIPLNKWVERHSLGSEQKPLRLDLNRLRTTAERLWTENHDMDVRAASITHSPQTRYANYLRPDKVVQRWADALVSDVFTGLEARFRRFREDRLGGLGLRVLSAGDTNALESPDAAETAYMACGNVTGNPDYPGVMCRASFLTCFSCPNAIVGDAHIPMILRLQKDLVARWGAIEPALWWKRYGQVWVAIKDDILATRTPAQLQAAMDAMPERSPLDRLERIGPFAP